MFAVVFYCYMHLFNNFVAYLPQTFLLSLQINKPKPGSEQNGKKRKIERMMEQANESTQIGRWNASNRKQGRCEWGRHIWNCLYSNKLNWVQTRNQLLESSNQTGMWAVVCFRSATKTKFNGLEHTVVWEQTRKTFVWFSAWQILTYVRLFACNDPSIQTMTMFSLMFRTWVRIGGRTMKPLYVLVSVCDLWIQPKYSIFNK